MSRSTKSHIDCMYTVHGHAPCAPKILTAFEIRLFLLELLLFPVRPSSSSRHLFVACLVAYDSRSSLFRLDRLIGNRHPNADSLSVHREDDPEPGLSAQHPIVGRGGLFKWERFDHGPNPCEGAKVQRVLRVLRLP
jgi:hypothetical protein